jgi:hypothetical protein
MLRYWAPTGLAAVFVSFLEPAVAGAVSQTPTISGNAWVAMALLIGFIGLIVLVVYGSLNLEKRDARLGRRRRDGGFFYPIVGNDDDDDIHHHGS